MHDRRSFLRSALPALLLGPSVRERLYGNARLGALPSSRSALQGVPQDPVARAREVQSLIAQARGEGRDHAIVPSALLPYAASRVTFDASIRMLRDSNLSGQYDIRAYGAFGDGQADDTVAIQAAVDGAAQKGGEVHLPEGTYRVSGIGLSHGVDLVGEGPGNTIIDGVGPSSTLHSTELLVGQSLSNFTVQHTNASATGIDLVDLAYGAYCCRIENVEFLGKASVTRSAFHLRGRNPVTGKPNRSQFNNLLLMCRCNSVGAQVQDGKALWLEGADIADARCNLNKVIGGSWNGFGTTFAVEAGNANLFCNLNVNSADRAAFDFRGDRQTFNNFIFGCFVDMRVSGSPLLVESRDTSPHTLVQVFGSSRIERPSDVRQVNPQARYAIFSRSVFLGNSQADALSGDRTQVVAGTQADGLVRLSGGPEPDSGGFLASGPSFGRAVSAVSDGGGASAVLKETGGKKSSFRVVTTPDGQIYNVRFQVDESGRVGLTNVLDFAASSGRSGRDPRRDAPDAWIEVAIGGATHYVPAYRP